MQLLFLISIFPPENSCFFLYAAKHNAEFSILEEFSLTNEESFETKATFVSNASKKLISKLDFSPTETPLSPHLFTCILSIIYFP